MRRRFDERVLRPSVEGCGLASWKLESRAIEGQGGFAIKMCAWPCGSGALGESRVPAVLREARS